jgi:ACR3 family arsenite efflux pump ArsB
MKEIVSGLDWNSIIKKYFVELVEIVKSGVDFTSKEVPLYLKELITYEFWSAIIYMVLFIGLAIFAGYCARYMRIKAKNSHSDDDVAGCWAATLACTGLCLIFTVQGVQEIEHAVKSAVAPRVVIVEKIQSLISDTKTCKQ